MRKALFLVAALGSAACSNTSTAPNHTSPYAGNYSGIVSGAKASGTWKLAVGSTTQGSAIARLASGIRLNTSGGDAITLLLAIDGAQSIELSGTINGNTATLTDANGVVTCTVTFSTSGVTGTCTVPHYGTLNAIGYLESAGVHIETYCGTQSPTGVSTALPSATLAAVRSGPQVVLVRGTVGATPVVFTGVANGSSVTLTAPSYSTQYIGTISADSSTIGGTWGGTGTWAVNASCAWGALTAATTSVALSVVQGDTSLTTRSVHVAAGGTGTLGVIYSDTIAYSGPKSGWLQATLNDSSTTAGVLVLGVRAPNLAAGTYSATVPVFATLGTGSPVSVSVTLTVTSATPTVTSIMPNSGSVAGGTAVRITGTNFVAPVTAKLGNIALTNVVLVSSTTITATTPAAAATGTVSLSVGTPKGTATEANAFTYTLSNTNHPWTTVSTTWSNVGTVGGLEETTVCGLTTSGAAYCFGANTWGMLGDGTSTSRTTPVAVSGGLKFAEISTGEGATCGVTTGQLAYCWGQTAFGALGNGAPHTSPWQTTPSQVASGLTWSTVQVSEDGGACGLTVAGATYCWGTKGYNYTSLDTVPVALAASYTFTTIVDAGSHGCGLDASGVAWCWGQNENGELGDGVVAAGDTTYRTTPVQVSGGHTFVQISVGQWVSCGVTSDHQAYCWGDDRYGQAGDGRSQPAGNYNPLEDSVPTLVLGGYSWQAVYTNKSNGTTCGITTSGAAYCWGSNGFGGFGNGTTTSSSTPVAAAPGLTFAVLSLGLTQTCGVTTGGDMYCWGQGYMGDGNAPENALTPVLVNASGVSGSRVVSHIGVH